MLIDTKVVENVAIWIASIATAIVTFWKTSVFLKKKLKKWGEEMFTEKLESSLNTLTNHVTETSNAILSDQQKILNNQRIFDAKQRVMMNMFAEFTFETNATGEWTLANRRLCKFVGKDEDDVLQKQWLNIIVPFDRVRVLSEFMQAVEQRRSVEIECSMYKDGKVIVPVMFQTQKMSCTDGKFFGYLGTITEKSNN